MRKNSVEYLIRDGLGYCCEWFFFQRFYDTNLIAARLGCSRRAAQEHKAAALEGSCLGVTNCLQCRVKAKAAVPSLPSRD